MAEYMRTELEENYEAKCQEILNFCSTDEDKIKQIGDKFEEGSNVSIAVPSNSNYNINYDYHIQAPLVFYNSTQASSNNLNFNGQNANQVNIVTPNPVNYSSMSSYTSSFTCIQNAPNIIRYHPAGSESYHQFNRPRFIGPHIYSTGTGFDPGFVSGSNRLQHHSHLSTNNLIGNKFGSFSKNFAKKSSFRKYSKYMPPPEEIFPEIDITPEMLGITNRSNSSFLNFLTIFRRLSIYIMELNNERISLENIITGHKSVVNCYLPTVISNISSHVRMVLQALGYEFFEIWKLIDSIEIINFEKHGESAVRKHFQLNLNELETFANIKIKQKNGEILLSNEKNSQLETSLNNLIYCVRYYSIFMEIMGYKYMKIHDSKKSNSKNTPDEHVEENKNSHSSTKENEKQLVEKRTVNYRTPGF